MVDIGGLVSDPDFQAYPLAERLKVLQQVGADPKFIQEYASLGDESPHQQTTPEAPPQPEPSTMSNFLTMLTGLNEQERSRGISTEQATIADNPKLSFIEKMKGMGKAELTQPQSLPTALMIDPVGALMRMTGMDPKGGNVVGSMENIPAVGAALGSGGGPPGVALGAAGGESIRQLLRRSLGLPAATGLMQHLGGMDPNSPEAAATGMVSEALTGPAADITSAALQGVGNWAKKSSLRNLINLLQPGKAREKEAAMQLAERMSDEGIAPALTFRETQVKNAQTALNESIPALKAEQNTLTHQGAQIPTADIVAKVRAQVPDLLPGGGVPETGMALRNAADRVVSDVENSLGGANNLASHVPLDVAISEKQRWDELLKGFYNTGRDVVPEAKQFTKVAADAWRKAIHETYPQLGVLDAKVSDLISINNLLKDALNESIRVGGLGTAAQEGAATGSFLVGRPSILAMAAAKAGISSGPWASLSSSAKKMLSEILKGGAATTQTWLRLAHQFQVPDEVPPAEAVPELADAIENVMPNQSAKDAFINKRRVTKEDFIRRYQ